MELAAAAATCFEGKLVVLSCLSVCPEIMFKFLCFFPSFPNVIIIMITCSYAVDVRIL